MEIKGVAVAQEIQRSGIEQGINGSPVVSIRNPDNEARIAPEGTSGRVGVWRVGGWYITGV